MLLSAFDPALLVYNYEHWRDRETHCLVRFEALLLHRGMLKKYEQKMAMSDTFAALIQELFPWNTNYYNIEELRDLRQFFFEDLQKAKYIKTNLTEEETLQPTGILCQYIEAPELIGAWQELLHSLMDDVILAEFDPQIATWETDNLRRYESPMTLVLHDSENETGFRTYQLPLVWDVDSWASQLVTQEWWPDLQRCVELHFIANPGMRQNPQAREQPIPFEATNAFWRSVNHYCQSAQLHRSLIHALTKRVYGMLDASLGDEPFRNMHRFRVTDFWRVHYRKGKNLIVLEEFGPHSMGGVS